MSHNLKTGVDIFKAMWRLKGLRSCCVQWVEEGKK
jgi:hypothetical protein